MFAVKSEGLLSKCHTFNLRKKILHSIYKSPMSTWLFFSKREFCSSDEFRNTQPNINACHPLVI